LRFGYRLAALGSLASPLAARAWDNLGELYLPIIVLSDRLNSRIVKKPTTPPKESSELTFELLC
jgi:hypothetical protein